MTIDELIAAALPVMTAEVVDRARKLRPAAPLARLKFWYYDTCAPSCYLLAKALTAADRDEIVATKGINAGGILYDGDGPLEFAVGLGDDSASRPILARAYELMSMDEDELAAAGLPYEEAKAMSRWLAQALSRHLNALDWTPVVPVTDDFIVFAQNGTDYGCDCYKDLIASVPPEKLDLLRSRGLMGPGDSYSAVPAARRKG